MFLTYSAECPVIEDSRNPLNLPEDHAPKLVLYCIYQIINWAHDEVVPECECPLDEFNFRTPDCPNWKIVFELADAERRFIRAHGFAMWRSRFEYAPDLSTIATGHFNERSMVAHIDAHIAEWGLYHTSWVHFERI